MMTDEYLLNECENWFLNYLAICLQTGTSLTLPLPTLSLKAWYVSSWWANTKGLFWSVPFQILTTDPGHYCEHTFLRKKGDNKDSRNVSQEGSVLNSMNSRVQFLEFSSHFYGLPVVWLWMQPWELDSSSENGDNHFYFLEHCWQLYEIKERKHTSTVPGT
jgi:hypothetical protein